MGFFNVGDRKETSWRWREEKEEKMEKIVGRMKEVQAKHRIKRANGWDSNEKQHFEPRLGYIRVLQKAAAKWHYTVGSHHKYCQNFEFPKTTSKTSSNKHQRAVNINRVENNIQRDAFQNVIQFPRDTRVQEDGGACNLAAGPAAERERSPKHGGTQRALGRGMLGPLLI